MTCLRYVFSRCVFRRGYIYDFVLHAKIDMVLQHKVCVLQNEQKKWMKIVFFFGVIIIVIIKVWSNQ